jgi:hypothetical protein
MSYQFLDAMLGLMSVEGFPMDGSQHCEDIWAGLCGCPMDSSEI